MRDIRNTTSRYVECFRRTLQELGQSQTAIDQMEAWLEGTLEDKAFFDLLIPKNFDPGTACPVPGTHTATWRRFPVCNDGAVYLNKHDKALLVRYIRMLFMIGREMSWFGVSELDIQDLISSGVSRWMLYGMLVQGLNWGGLWQAQQGQDPEELMLAARKCTGNARWVLIAVYLSKFTKEECQSPRGFQKILDKFNGNEDEKQIQRSEWLVKIEGQVEKAIPLIAQTRDVRFKRMVSSISWLIRNVSDQGVQQWLRVCKMMPQECYGACYHCVGEEFLEGIQKIELGRELTKEYIIWMTNGRINEKYFVPYCRKDVDMFMEVINEGNIWDSKNLLKALKVTGKNEQLEFLANEGVERFVEEVRKVNSEYADLLFDFIQGKTDGSEWWNKLQKYNDSKWNGNNNEARLFNRYRQIRGLDETAVKMHMWMWKTLPGYAISWYQEMGKNNLEPEYLRRVLELMRKVYPQENFIVPVAERCVQEGWYSNLNREDLVTNPVMYGRRYFRVDDEVFGQAVREIFHQVLEENLQDFLAAVPKAGVEARAWLYVFLYQEDPKNAELLLNYFDENAKTARNVLTRILQRCPELHDKVSLKLNSKKAAQRELAIDILSAYNNEESRQSLRTAMENEKSAKLLEKLKTVINTESGKTVNDTQQLAAELIKGNKKNILAWIYANPMPEVKKKDGTIASQDYLCALMLSYAGMNVLGVSKTAAQIAEDLEKESLGVFALEVFERWLAEGALAKKKWVLYFASIHGSAEIVPALKKQIQQWPDLSRGAIAAEAVFALALHPGDGALMIVDSISRKFKFRQVKTAAGEALSYAAKELGITVEQLSDRIVPDLGFDEKCQQIVNYGKRSFTVYLTPALELEIFDEKGKKLKSMPAPGKMDEQETAQGAYTAFKQMKKDMKTTVSAQKLRLELALSSDRKWTVQEWTDLFVRKPIMHQFAIGLIWGLYIEEELSQTFRYMEDGTFNTSEEEEMELPENGRIGLIHPLELNAEVKEQWKTQLEDYEIKQPILQLDRPVYLVEEAERSLKELERFGGKVINSMSLTGKMQNGGWSRGPAMDGGMMYYFYVENSQLNVGAHLNIKGMYAGLDPDEYTTLQTVQFYQVDKVKEHLQEVYDKIKVDDCIENGEVPGRFFSETIYHLTKVAAVSTGTIEEDWRT